MKAYIKLSIKLWNVLHPFAFVLLGAWTGMQGNSWLHSILPKNLFQQLLTVYWACQTQMKNRRQQSDKYLNDEKMQSSIKSRKFQRLNRLTNPQYKYEQKKLEIEHRELVFIGIFILQTIRSTGNIGVFFTVSPKFL